jgi:hypothetical protein
VHGLIFLNCLCSISCFPHIHSHGRGLSLQVVLVLSHRSRQFLLPIPLSMQTGLCILCVFSMIFH